MVARSGEARGPVAPPPPLIPLKTLKNKMVAEAEDNMVIAYQISAKGVSLLWNVK